MARLSITPRLQIYFGISLSLALLVAAGTSEFSTDLVGSKLSLGIEESPGIVCSTGVFKLFHSSVDLILFAVKLPKTKLITKNAIANQVVAFVKKLPEPLEPNIVADEPAPKDAPISAPLPCWIKTKPIKQIETNK
jgi:hypothetical protein